MSQAKKFGAFAGVFTPSLLTILGVIMYMRLGWVVGNAGLWGTIGIIFLAHVISITTGLSVSSIATDKKIKAGGIYYMLSRSLGLPIGGAIGITLFLGTALSIALYLVGFAESFNAFVGFGDTTNDFRITATCALLLLTVIAYISTSVAIKTQFFILAAIAISLLAIVFGSSDNPPETVQLFSGSNSAPFELIFAIFFPAVTGFTAGVAMSGDLKDPKKSIPLGTLSAIAVGFVVYVGLAVFLAYSVDGSALRNDYNILMKIAIWAPLVVAGIWGATLSSALGGILGGPRIMQALSIDRVTPFIFGKGVGESNEPRNALLLTFAIAEVGVLIGELDAIAEVVSMFYLAAYGFINLSALLESWASSDFRPSFKVPKWIAALGAIATFAVMFKLNALAMIASLVIITGIFLYLTRKQLAVGSGDVWMSVWSSIVRSGLKRMDKAEMHKRNWEPNILLFSGGTDARPHLLQFSKALAGKVGMISNFDLHENSEAKVLFPKPKEGKHEESTVDGVFFKSMECQNVFKGIEAIASTYGFSGVEPNTVLMGWAKNTKDPLWFAQMTQTLTELDYNVLYLDYDQHRGFGKKQTIDVWWHGTNNHSELTLSLLKFLKQSADWNGAESRIVLVNHHEGFNKDLVLRNIRKTLDEFRLNATIKVVDNVKDPKPLYDIMKVVSASTDLILVGIPEFESGSERDFVAKTNELVRVIGTTLLIRASSRFEHAELVPEDLVESTSNADAINIVKHETINRRNYTLPLDTNTHPALNQLIERISDLEELVVNDRVSKLAVSYKRIVHLLNNEAVKRAKIQPLEDARAQADAFIDKSVSEIKRFEEDQLEVLADYLKDSVERVISFADKVPKVLPKHVLREYADSELRPVPGDSFRIKRMKFFKRTWKNKLGVKPKAKINFNQLVRFYLEKSLLVNFNRFLDEVSTGGYESQRELSYYCSDAYAVLHQGDSEKSKIEALEKLERKALNRFDDLHDRFHSFFAQLENHLLNAIIRDLHTLDINDKSEERINGITNPKKIRSELRGRPADWSLEQSLFLNYTRAETQLQKLRGAINKRTNDFKAQIDRTLFVGAKANLRELSEDVEAISQKLSKKQYTDFESVSAKADSFLAVNFEQPLNELITDVKGVVKDLPSELDFMQQQSMQRFLAGDRSRAVSNRIALRSLANYMVESRLIDPVQKEVERVPEQFRKIYMKVQHALRLIDFSVSAIADNERSEATDLSEVLKRAQAAVDQAMDQVSELESKTLGAIDIAKDECLEKLIANLNVGDADNIEQYIRKENQLRGLNKYAQIAFQKARNQWQTLSQIWREKKSDYKRASFEGQSRYLENTNAKLREFVEKVTVKKEVWDALPFYYRQLFVGKHLASTSSLENRQREQDIAKKALQRINAGAGGGILVVGQPLSGRSFMCERIAMKLTTGKSYRINPPEGGSTSEAVFNRVLSQTTGLQGRTEAILEMLPEKSVIILNDAELWWDRSPKGIELIQRITKLIDRYSKRHIFILNMNLAAFYLIDQLTAFSSHFITTIRLSPFSAEEAAAAMSTRHLAGGLSFVWNGIAEENLSAQKLKRLHAKYYSLSKGNMGLALQQWLANIDKIENDRLYISSPASHTFPEISNPDHLVFLQQVMLHTTVSRAKLKKIYPLTDDAILGEMLAAFIRAGVLIEKLPGVFTIDPFVRPYLFEYLKSKQLFNA